MGTATDVTEESSSSVARLRERVQGTLRINLGSLARQRRISSLQELRRNAVEAKRSDFLRRLQGLMSPSGEPPEDDDATTETDMDIESDDSSHAIDDGIGDIPVKKSGGKKYSLTRDVSKILTWPEFLVATDREIREEAIALKHSLMFVRPEGRRVLIVINKFIATEYWKDGTKRRSFQVTFSKGPTMLDCVVKDYSYDEECDITQLRYFVLDVLMYNGCLLAHSDTECRIFFLRSRLEEAATECERPRFSMIEYYGCTPVNMLDAYYRIDNIPYDRDSLMFVDRRASYIGGYNPNWLCWRDENTSKYVEQSKHGPISARVICDATDNLFKTLEGVAVGKVPRRLKRKRDFVTT